MTAQAALVQVTVTARNLSPVNSTSFAPLRVGFNNGTFDSFNNGQTAGAAIVSVAEGGSASAWFPAFMAADANATLGTVGAVLVPGTSATQTFFSNAALAANPDIYSISFTANAVPEPQSYAMVGLALLALGVTGRRRGQKARAG